MAIQWGAWSYGTPSSGSNRGMRVGIDVSFSAVSNTSTSCTATMKFYTENHLTWSSDKQQLEFDGNYSLPETHDYTNYGDDGVIEYRTTRTYTWNYSSSSYNVVPTVLDINVEVRNTYNGMHPTCELHINFPKRPYGTPNAPSSCAASRTSDTSTKITWTRNPTTGKPYDAMWLERYIYGYAGWSRIATLSGSATSHTDTGTIANRKYSYRVQADNSVGTSGYSQISSPFYTTPAAPSSPSRAQGTGTTQALTWALSVGYTEYQTEVWRAVDGVWALLTTLAAGVTKYTDTTANPSTKVKYRFRTKTTSGPQLYSAYSAETTETTGILLAPAAPTNLYPVADEYDPTAPVQHSWQHNPSDGTWQTGFQIRYRYVGDPDWILTGQITSSQSSWTMPADTVAKGNDVEWQVQTWGYDETLAGAWSASAVWPTSPVLPRKYPLYLDVTTGRVEANSQGRRVTALGSEDLNSLDDGVYSQTTSADATEARHYPAGKNPGWPVAGLLEQNTNPEGTMVWQRYTPYGDYSRSFFVRSSYLGTWSVWTETGLDPVELGPNIDLNTLTATGVYTQSASAETSLALNYPIAAAGLLEVFLNETTNMVWQRFTPYSNYLPQGVFVRGFYNTAWSAWYNMLTDITAGDGITVSGSGSAGYTISAAGKETNISPCITAASGWSVDTALGFKLGNMVHINAQFTRTGAAIAGTTGGDISNTVMGSITASLRALQTVGATCYDREMTQVKTDSGGNVQVCSRAPTRPINTGEIINCSFVYPVNW